MRSFYDSCTEFLSPEQTTRPASSEKTRIFSMVFPLVIGSDLCFLLAHRRQPTAETLNITRASPLDYGWCLSPHHHRKETLQARSHLIGPMQKEHMAAR